ncbi:hypothetical protein ACYSNM_08175 [Myroides sp. LJL116]
METSKKQDAINTGLPRVKNQDFIFNLLQEIKESKIDFIDTFTDEALCKELFRLPYPLLLDVTAINRFDVTPYTVYGGKPRYYTYKSKNVFVFENRKYLVTNHWYDPQRRLVSIWFELSKQKQKRKSALEK